MNFESGTHIGLDQFGNALIGGDSDETISSRIGKLKRMHGGTIPWRYPLVRIIDKVLDDIDPNHSIDAIEEDEGKDGLLLWTLKIKEVIQ